MQISAAFLTTSLTSSKQLVYSLPPPPRFASLSFFQEKLQACKNQPSGFLASESPVADINSTRKQIYQRNAKLSVSKCSLLLCMMAARELIDAVC
jgi:hypothetical protein